MKIIYRIARLELSTLFFSPVAWIVLLIFLFQSGWLFYGTVERYQNAQEMGTVINDMSRSVFGGFMGLFTKMQENLYLYIPLLTMGLVSREIGSGSIKLVLSSPISISEIIIGKYVAMMVYCFLLISILGLFVITGCFTIDHFDIGYALSGLLGLYLLICAYSSIGLFMSCLTSYQVVAAISTLVTLAALSYIGKLWQDYDFVRDLTYFLSISGRAEQFINGLVGSKDVMYFLVIIVLFIALSILKIYSERASKPLPVRIAQYVGIIAAALLVGYISSRPRLAVYADLTVNKNQTLTPNSQAIITKMDEEPLKITTYVNLLEENYFMGLPMSRNSDVAHFEQYMRFKPDIEISYIYYYAHANNPALYAQNPGLTDAQLAKKMAGTAGLDFNKLLSPAQLAQKIDLEPEGFRMIREVSYKGKKTLLRIYDDLQRQPSEKEISAALKRLIAPVPVVAFVTGEYERSINKKGDKDYQVSTIENAFRYSLKNQGFDLREVNLSSQDIPANIAVLVIADPKVAFSAAQTLKIQQYIDRGGNLLINGEPGSQSVLNPLLSKIGVKLMDGQLIQQSADNAPDFILGNLAADWKNPSVPYQSLISTKLPVSMPGVAALQQTTAAGYSAQALVTNNAQLSWNALTLPDVTKGEISFNAAKGVERKEFPMILSLTRTVSNKNQKIIVAGDADFMSNSELMRSNMKTANFNLVVELFSWFSNGEFPIDTTRPEPLDNRLKLDKHGVFTMKIIYLGVLPALITILVAIILLRRRRN